MSTHSVVVNQDTVRKTYRSWRRREPHREWHALELLAQYAPELAPEPVHATLTGDPPVVVMSRIPGEPLDASTIDSEHVTALARAIDTLHRAVPPDRLTHLPRSRISPTNVNSDVRRQSCDSSYDGADAVVRQALTAGAEWLTRDADTLTSVDTRRVFGTGDGNLANFLWDGATVRLVDFEDSGSSDRAVELANMAEHLSMWVPADVTTRLLSHFDLTPAEAGRLREARRLYALDWLLMLLPGGAAHHRNPPDTLRRQATRALELLG